MNAERPAYRAVNLLFLIVLLLQISNLFLLSMPQYVRLILNQALFVLLPAYLYLRLTRQPIRERVRWRWPGWKVAALALLIGAALYPLSAAGAGVLQQLLGYVDFALPGDAIPSTALMGVLAIVAYAVMAPVCEEFLFRGVIQPVYERRGARWGVLGVGLLFIVFHLSLLQGLSIILLALALGYVNYRTRSLPASILTHVGANSLAAMVLTGDLFFPGITALLFSPPALLAGPLVALIAFVAFVRLTRRADQPPPEVGPAPAGRPLAPAAGWPLLIAGALYLLVIGAEFHHARTIEPLRVGAAAWGETDSWQYEIRNIVDDVVGDGECRLIQDGPLIELTCTSTVITYEVWIDNSYWASSGGGRIETARWQAADGRLVDGESVMDIQDVTHPIETSWTVSDDGIAVRTLAGDEDRSFHLPWEETPLAEDHGLLVLTDLAAPWQLAAMTLEQGTRGEAARFHPSTWRPATQDSGPVIERWPVTVAGREEVTTPAGSFDLWRVTWGTDRTIWYDNTDRPVPVRFFSGIETWSLQ